MKILRMTATFGCLEEAELVLEPGLNVLQLPNEYGKSTWAAFLLAMFYGVDTSQRSARGRLPDKTRYQPWSGKAMCGRIELQHQGRVIVLQRTASRTKPMGNLQAYDKETGLHLPEITADNCGMYFLGVERSVFQRTAFLSGEDLTVTQDDSLSRRLENMTVSGDADDSYLPAAARLKQWKNRIRYHRTGLLPEAEAQLQETKQALALMQSARSEAQEAHLAMTRAAQEAVRLEQEEALRWQWEKDRTAAALSEAMTQWEQAVEPAARKSRGSLWLLAGVVTTLLAGAISRFSPWGWLVLLLWLLWGWLWYRTPASPADSQARRLAREQVEQTRLAYDMAAAPRTPGEELLAAQKNAAHLRQTWEQLQNHIPSPEERDVLTAKAETQRRQVQQLLQKEQALTLAQEALEKAAEQQARVYAPRLTLLAGDYLSRLTGGKYNALILEGNFSLQVQEHDSGLTRPLIALSSGTRDQVWLALRLAMARLLLPEDAPLWLDDALLTFDDLRTDLAMELLKAEPRQVILMCCK